MAYNVNKVYFLFFMSTAYHLGLCSAPRCLQSGIQTKEGPTIWSWAGGYGRDQEKQTIDWPLTAFVQRGPVPPPCMFPWPTQVLWSHPTLRRKCGPTTDLAEVVLEIFDEWHHRESLKVICSKTPKHLLPSMYLMMGKQGFLLLFVLKGHILAFWQFKSIDSFIHLKRSF